MAVLHAKVRKEKEKGKKESVGKKMSCTTRDSRRFMASLHVLE